MHFPDFFERAQKENALPHQPGIQEFEAMTVLGAAIISPQQTKSALAQHVLTLLERPVTETRSILRTIDDLVRIQFLYKHQFRYEITVAGRHFLRQARGRNLNMFQFFTNNPHMHL